MLTPYRLFLGFALIVSMAGCSGNDRPVRQKVNVTLEGEPLAGVTVTFMSTANKRPAWGTTDEEGSFELTTYAAEDGAVPGEYKIIVNSATPPGAGDLPEGLISPEVIKASRRKLPPIHP